jgi:hypothetical protein
VQQGQRSNQRSLTNFNQRYTVARIVKRVVVMEGASDESVYDSIIARCGRLDGHLERALRCIQRGDSTGAEEMIRRVKVQVEWSAHNEQENHDTR